MRTSVTVMFAGLVLALGMTAMMIWYDLSGGRGSFGIFMVPAIIIGLGIAVAGAGSAIRDAGRERDPEQER